MFKASGMLGDVYKIDDYDTKIADLPYCQLLGEYRM